MVEAPEANAAALLLDGRVVVMGGPTIRNGERFPFLAELYDPPTRSWASTGSLLEPRQNFAAITLVDGRVLVPGGYPGPLASTEVYLADAATFSATGNLVVARDTYGAARLANGTVLIAGGTDTSVNEGHALAAAELYDPVTGSWTATGSMAEARIYFTVTLLNNGKVLVAGGSSKGTLGDTLASAELFDPVEGTWTATGEMTVPRTGHDAALLPDGRVLVVGGQNDDGIVAAAEVYDPATGTWSTTGSLIEPRYDLTVVALGDGKILAVGGSAGHDALPTAEVYDPNTGAWTSAGSMVAGRSSPTATLLDDGTVLVVGGNSRIAAEIYDPVAGQ